MIKSTVLTIAFEVSLASGALAWGDRGHSIVAEIAQRHLTPQTEAAVHTILGENASLASVSSWADDFKFTPEGLATKPWHFVDVDNSHDAYAPTDCPASGCPVSALQEEVEILGTISRPAADRRQALLLLVHLVGNSTQPFHCSERDGDGGGNAVKVDFQGVGPDGAPRPVHGMKLHALWDDTLIDDHTWNWGGYAAALDEGVVPKIADVIFGAGDWAESWINQCHAVAREMYALIPTSGTIRLGSDYQAAVQPVLDRQLATGGMRLAALLNSVLGGQ